MQINICLMKSKKKKKKILNKLMPIQALAQLPTEGLTSHPWIQFLQYDSKQRDKSKEYYSCVGLTTPVICG